MRAGVKCSGFLPFPPMDPGLLLSPCSALLEGVVAGPKKLPHCSREGDYSATSPRVRYADGGRLLQIFFERSPGMEWNQEQFPYRRDGKSAGSARGIRVALGVE